MNRRYAVRIIAFGGAGSCAARFLNAHPGDDETPNYTIHSEVRLVLLDVSVTDSSGSIVPGLPKTSFQVLENGRPQAITVFENQDVPVTVGLLVDESRSMGPKRAAVLTAAEILIRESNPRDEIFVVNFNSEVRRGLPDNELFSDNIDKLRAALYRGRAEGKTALNDAIVAGIDQLREGRRDKKTLVLISDGGDNASRHTRGETLESVEASVSTIYTIGLFDEEDIDRNPGFLKRLASLSGGQAFFPADSAGTIPVCRKIAKQIRSRYTVGYVPAPEKGYGLRRIQVRVSDRIRRGLQARTRSVYRY